ncbi:unnamed protein product, partial [marine sediment metagenome]
CPNWLLAEFIIICSNIFLKSTFLFTLICAGITTVYTLTIVSISIGFGALFPDFTESNPSKIVGFVRKKKISKKVRNIIIK